MRRFPERDDLRIALARVALVLGNPSQAREAVLAIAPASEQHAAALVLRAQAELQLGDLERALATLAEAERLYPDRPEARLVRIQALISEHRRDEARAAIGEAQRALTGDDDETEELRHRLDVTLAQLRAEQGETEPALESLREMVRIDPKDMLAWRAIAGLLDEAEARRGGDRAAGEGSRRARGAGGALGSHRPAPRRSRRGRGRRGSAPQLRRGLGLARRSGSAGRVPLRARSQRRSPRRRRRVARALPGRGEAATPALRGAARGGPPRGGARRGAALRRGHLRGRSAARRT